VSTWRSDGGSVGNDGFGRGEGEEGEEEEEGGGGRGCGTGGGSGVKHGGFGSSRSVSREM
jgi:hypothetical protein